MARHGKNTNIILFNIIKIYNSIFYIKNFKFVFADLIFMGLTFSISVAACVREKQLTDASNSASIFEFAINKGGFAASGVNIVLNYEPICY